MSIFFNKLYDVNSFPEWCEAGQVKVYLCDKQGNVSAQYYSITDYDDRFKVSNEVLEMFKKKAIDTNKEIAIQEVSPEQTTVFIKGSEYVIHLYTGTCILTCEEFQKLKEKETPQKMLASI